MALDPIKEAFQKVKQDIATLQHELQRSNQQTNALHLQLQTLIQQIQALQHTKNETLSNTKEVLTEQYKGSSTGNEGVPTNQQTNQQSNQHTKNEEQSAQKHPESHPNKPTNELETLVSSLEEAQILLKKQLSTLTKQEFHIYALIYQLQLEGKTINYPSLAEKSNLSEISIRDYTLKLLKKGIPLLKHKHNNKNITLEIPLAFTKIASLPALMAYYAK
jgi:hypothetical protein